MSLFDELHARGPVTVATFMELALYHPTFGYYARAVRRTGRAGDFFTSVDVGPLFGELLEVQLAEMFETLTNLPANSAASEVAFDLVEAGAADGRLAADILGAAKRRDPFGFQRLRLHLVEASERARRAQVATLGDLADRLASTSASLPESFEGVLLANELLDAMPVHQVVKREDGLREVYVAADPRSSRDSTKTRDQESFFVGSCFGGRSEGLRLVEGPLSTLALQHYLDALDIQLELGWRAEINLRAVDWMRDAARRLRRGFILLIDYGHDARELYSATHAAGTLTTFAAHHGSGPERTPLEPSWLQQPGDQDITSHVDFTSVRAAAEDEGMTTIAWLDQTYFLLGLLPSLADSGSVLRNPQYRTLMMPGGLGSTHKVLILGKGVGAPELRGCSFKVRVT
jgi:SAM-dependent MidA family methyltransferase